MREVNIEEIVKTAERYVKDNIPWHHHFLTNKCQFNKSKNFQIILENESTGESFVSSFDYKPMEELELLENLFFGRKKIKESEEPGFVEAEIKRIEYNTLTLKYAWPFYTIFIGGLIILARFYLEKISLLIVILLFLFAIIVNFIYYKWIRNR